MQKRVPEDVHQNMLEWPVDVPSRNGFNWFEVHQNRLLCAQRLPSGCLSGCHLSTNFLHMAGASVGMNTLLEIGLI